MIARPWIALTAIALTAALCPQELSNIPDDQNTGIAVQTGGNEATFSGQWTQTIPVPEGSASQGEDSGASVAYTEEPTASRYTCTSSGPDNKCLGTGFLPHTTPDNTPTTTPDSTPITITIRDVATVMINGSGLNRQPSGNEIIKSKPLIVYTNPDPQTLTTTIATTTIEIEVTPTTYTWDWGDGTTTTTTDPGAPYPNHTLTHWYHTTALNITTTLTTTWTARYRPTGTTTWQPINGTLTTTETSTPYNVLRLTSLLTDTAEEKQGH